ncbi:MAG: potassium transporter Kup [Spirochaetota bacterium]
MSISGRSRQNLALAAIGVVFGDIGTSPLYALRECFAPGRGIEPNPENVIGLVSLLLWILTLIVSVKYLALVLRADNKGDGGILALVSLVGRNLPKGSRRRAGVLTMVGIIGASLLYSDGMLTPAVTVLSAIEGLKDVSPLFTSWVVPLTLAILLLLFAFQSKGTQKVGVLFGPVISIWFLLLAVLGVVSIVKEPYILAALDPRHAIAFLAREGWLSFRVLGSIFLAMTGAEVLYADLGHFGRRPIRQAWFSLVYPALILNYLGQGAILIGHPGEVGNLFFRLVPPEGLIPLVLIATAASIIASQAVISGVFSLAGQSVQLGYWPRIQVRHTSHETVGQVYVPLMKWVLLAGTMLLVLGFRESGKLANAYGIAVSADMVITSCLMVYVALWIWKKGLAWILPLLALFLVIEVSFLISNLGKIASGGWIVALMAIVIFILMRTWIDGRAIFREKMRSFRLAPDVFASSIALNPPHRVQGTAIFMTADPTGVPKALLHNLKHNRVLHARTILLTVRNEELPRIDEEERFEVKELEAGIWQVIVSFGFSESPDIPRHLRDLPIPGFSPDAMDTTYFVGREVLAFSRKPIGMAYPRKRIFGFMFANSLNATDFYRLPVNRIIELGAQTEL